MNTHEYQARGILSKYGIPNPEFTVVSTVDEGLSALEQMNLTSAVVKVQVHAGGRGKAGGVKLAHSKGEIIQVVDEMLGMKFVNNQTGPEGIIVKKLLISSILDYEKEYYLGAVVDRERAQATLIASPEGGVEIEEVAAEHPDRILTLPIGLDGSVRGYHLLRLIKFMGWQGNTAKQGKQIAVALAKAFVENDASLFEINPLVITKNGDLMALDAKFSIDENALFRQKEIAQYYDPDQLPEREAKAHEYDLAYIALTGNIGCMVNGAGLAMSTMDIIQHYGGMPANFLDVGGGATQEKVAEGFKIILADPHVEAVLVNIFGGIMNCVTLAAGIIAATGVVDIKVPLIVRLEGTNVEQGKKMLNDSELNIIIANDLADAAQKAVTAGKKEG